MGMAKVGMTLKKGAKWVQKKADKAITPLKLERATVFLVNEKTGKRTNPVKVQFNPSEYQISRGVSMSTKTGVGQEGDVKQMQAVKGSLATLTVTLYFDTVSDVYSVTAKDTLDSIRKKNVSKAKMGKALKAMALPYSPDDDPSVACDTLVGLVKYNHEQHAPNMIHFEWGALKFIGYVVSSNVSYTMFDPNGTPVKAKVSLTISGEESGLLAKKVSLPNESPDRTKERMLPFGDQLWMMAQEEYEDAGKWKVIAEANGVLNPRSMDRAVALKVPSIQ